MKRRRKNPRNLPSLRGVVERAGHGLRKRLGLVTHTRRIRNFGGHKKNPRALTKAAQRRQSKSLLDWARDQLKRPNMKFPGGRMSHDIARDQIALVRQRYATNPRDLPRFVIEAHKGKARLYYHEPHKFADRAGAKTFTSRNDARAMAVELKAGFSDTLQGWGLRVISA